MESLANIFNYLWTVHANAAISVYWFFITNVAAVALVLFMGYVFRIRIAQAVRSTTRLTKRIGHGYDVEEKILTGIEKQESDEKQTSIFLKYGAIFILVIIVTLISTKSILYSTTLMWGIGALAVYFLKGEKDEIADTAETHTIAYTLSVLLIEILIWFNTDVSPLDRSRSLRSALPPVASSTIAGYLPMLLDYVAIGVPLNYARIIWQNWRDFSGTDQVQRRMAQIQRTSNQSSGYDNDHYRKY